MLVFRVPRDVCLRVGRLGEYWVRAGCYAYVGSAFGPGGLRARLARHLRRGGRRHWHIDALKQVAQAQEAWVSRSRVSLEHAWATYLARMPGIRIPIRRFGASDCDCRSHLFRAGKRLLRVALKRLGAEPLRLAAACGPARALRETSAAAVRAPARRCSLASRRRGLRQLRPRR